MGSCLSVSGAKGVGTISVDIRSSLSTRELKVDVSSPARKNVRVLSTRVDHQAVIHSGTNNQPAQRQALIQEKLQKEGYIIAERSVQASTLPTLVALGIHSEELLYALQHAYTSWYQNGKEPQVFSQGGVIPLTIPPRNHCPSYQNHLQPQAWRMLGWFAKDWTTPIQKDTWYKALNCIEVVFEAVSMLMARRALTVYCSTELPGHHASFDRYGGYCILNNPACAARYYQRETLRSARLESAIMTEVRFIFYPHTFNELHLLELATEFLEEVPLPTPRVAILDLDYHAGDGTQDIFYRDPSVLTTSIHINPKIDYPFYSGYEQEHGKGDGKGFNINYALKAGAVIEEYLLALKMMLLRIQRFNPELLIVAFGSDTYKRDTEVLRSAGFRLEVADYFPIGYQIAQLRKPTLITQEGGYALDYVGRIVNTFLSGFETTTT